MSSITIRQISITESDTDAVVNAANSGLWQGGGVCGFIFRAAGAEQMTEACEKIGHCDVGSAVITPGFNLRAGYVIHAVGPRWTGGGSNEQALLYSAYQSALRLARENNLTSIAFPLISAGIFGYPLEQAWQVAVRACRDFISVNADFCIDIVFAVLDDYIKATGEKILNDSAG